MFDFLWLLLPWRCRACGEWFLWRRDRMVRSRSGNCCVCQQWGDPVTITPTEKGGPYAQ